MTDTLKSPAIQSQTEQSASSNPRVSLANLYSTLTTPKEQTPENCPEIPIKDLSRTGIQLDPGAAALTDVGKGKGDKHGCYCQEDLPLDQKKPEFECTSCHELYHQDCIPILRLWTHPCIIGDSYYWFKCARCKDPLDAESEVVGQMEDVRRYGLTWTDVCTITLFALNHSSDQGSEDERNRPYFSIAEIVRFVEEHWNQWWLKDHNANVRDNVVSCMSGNAGRFTSLANFTQWALEENQQPRLFEDYISNTSRTITCVINFDGSLIDFNDGKYTKRRRGKKDSYEDLMIDPSTGSLTSINAIVGKKRQRMYEDELLDPGNTIMLYPDLDNDNDVRVVMSNQPTHTAPQVNIYGNGMCISNEKGYRMAKATHGVWEGYWYFEATIDNDAGHARIGWSQISGDLQAPCGYDKFSYSFRDKPGTLFHNSKACKDPEEVNGSSLYDKGYRKGDILGVAIYIPPRKKNSRDAREFGKECAVDTNLLRRLWDPERMENYAPFKSKPLTTVTKSFIEYYRNGQALGPAFKNLNFGKYHPTISLFGGCKVTVHFGPQFIYPMWDKEMKGMYRVRELDTWEESMDKHKTFLDLKMMAKQEAKKKAIHLKDGSAEPSESTALAADSNDNFVTPCESRLIGAISPLDGNAILHVSLPKDHAPGGVVMPSSTRAQKDIVPMLADRYPTDGVRNGVCSDTVVQSTPFDDTPFLSSKIALPFSKFGLPSVLSIIGTDTDEESISIATEEPASPPSAAMEAIDESRSRAIALPFIVALPSIAVDDAAVLMLHIPNESAAGPSSDIALPSFAYRIDKGDSEMEGF